MQELKLMHSTILIDDNELVIKDRLKYQKIFSIIAGTSVVLFALTTFMNGGQSFTSEKFYYYFLFPCGISLIFFSLKLNVRDRLSKDDEKEKLISFLEFNNIKTRNSKYGRKLSAHLIIIN